MENVNTRVQTIRFLYGLLAAGFLVCVVLQVFLAGMGIFVDANDLDMHRTFANYFEFAPLVMFILSFFGQIRGSLRWLTLVMLAVGFLQHITVQVFSGSLQALHTVDALILFGIAWFLTRRSWSWLAFNTTTRTPS